MTKVCPCIPGLDALETPARQFCEAVLKTPELYRFEECIPLPSALDATVFHAGFDQGIDFLRASTAACSWLDLCSFRLIITGHHTVLQLKSKYPGHIPGFSHAVDVISREVSLLTAGLTGLPNQAAAFYQLYQRITAKYRYSDADPLCHSVYGLVHSGQGVCQAVAGLVRICCSELGIRCSIVADREEPHCWNVVTLDGISAHFDATWDLGATPDSGYQHYGLTSGDVHRLADHNCCDAQIPVCNSNALNWYYHKQLVIKADEFVSFMMRKLSSGHTATCRVSNYKEVSSRALMEDLVRHGNISRCSYSPAPLGIITIYTGDSK